MQLPRGAPAGVMLTGRVNVNAEPRMRNPLDPVSTITWSMLWQVVVPGTQIVTVVNAASTLYPAGRPVGPLSTTIGWTLLTAGVNVTPELVEVELPPPPEPHPARLSASTTKAAAAPPGTEPSLTEPFLTARFLTEPLLTEPSLQ